MQPSDELSARLRSTPFFEALPTADIERLSEVAEIRSIARGDLLFRQGEPLTDLYFLLDGRIKLAQVGADGHEMIMRFVGPGEVFAVVVAFDGGHSCPVSASAVTDARMASWPRSVATILVRELPAFSLALTQELTRHAHEFQQRLREVGTESVPQRLAHVLIRLAETAGRPEVDGTAIDFPVTRQDLAGMVGSTLFTVSRLLSDWSARGIVDAGRTRVRVLSPEALQSLADAAEDKSTDQRTR